MDSVLYQDSGGSHFQQEREHAFLKKMDDDYSRFLSSDTEEITDANIAWSTAIAVVILLITISLAFFCLCFDGIWTVAERLEDMFITPVVTRLREEHFELEMSSEKKTLKDIFAPILRAIFSRYDDKGDDDDEEEEDEELRRKKGGRLSAKERRQKAQANRLKKMEERLRAAKKRPKEVKTRTVLPPPEVAAGVAASRASLGRAQTPTLLRAEEAEVAARGSEAPPPEDIRELQMWMTSGYASGKKNKRTLDLLAPKGVLANLEELEAGGGLGRLTWEELLGGDDIEYDEEKDKKGNQSDSEAGGSDDDSASESEEEDANKGGDGTGGDGEEDGEGEEHTGWYRVVADGGVAVKLTFSDQPGAEIGKGKSFRIKKILKLSKDEEPDPEALNLYSAQKKYLESLTAEGGGGATVLPKGTVVRRLEKTESGGERQFTLTERLGETADDEFPVASFKVEDKQYEEEFEEIPESQTWYRVKTNNARVFKDPTTNTREFKDPTTTDADLARDTGLLGTLKKDALVASWNWRVYNPEWRRAGEVISDYWCVQTGCRRLREYAFEGEPARFCEHHQKERKGMKETGFSKCTYRVPDSTSQDRCQNEWKFVIDGKSGSRACADHQEKMLEQKKEEEIRKGEEEKKGNEDKANIEEEQNNNKVLLARENECQEKGCQLPWRYSTGGDAEGATGEEEEEQQKGKKKKNCCGQTPRAPPREPTTYGKHYCEGHGKELATQRCTEKDCNNLRQYGYAGGPPRLCYKHFQEIETTAIKFHRIMDKTSESRTIDSWSEVKMERLDTHNFCEFDNCQNPWLYFVSKKGAHEFSCEEHSHNLDSRLTIHNLENDNQLIPVNDKLVPRTPERYGRCLNHIIHDGGEECSNARSYGLENDMKPIVCGFHKKNGYMKLDEANQCAKRACKESWSHFKPVCLRTSTSTKVQKYVPELKESEGDNKSSSKAAAAALLSFGAHYCAKHRPAADDQYEGHVTRCAHTAQQDPRWFKMMRKGIPANRQLVVCNTNDLPQKGVASCFKWPLKKAKQGDLKRGYVDEMDFYTKPATRMLQVLELSFFARKDTRASRFPKMKVEGETQLGEGALRRMGEEITLVQVAPAFANHPEVRNGTYVQSSFGFFDAKDLVRHYNVNLTLFRHLGAFRKSPGGGRVEWKNITVIFRHEKIEVVPPEAKFMDHPDIITGKVVRVRLGLEPSVFGYVKTRNMFGESVLTPWTDDEEKDYFEKKKNKEQPPLFKEDKGKSWLSGSCLFWNSPVVTVFQRCFRLAWLSVVLLYHLAVIPLYGLFVKGRQIRRLLLARIYTHPWYITITNSVIPGILSSIKSAYEWARYKLFWLSLYALIAFGTWVAQVARMLSAVFLIIRGLATLNLSILDRLHLIDLSFRHILLDFNPDFTWISDAYAWLVGILSNIGIDNLYERIFGDYYICEGAQAPAELLGNVIVAIVVVGVFKMEVYSFLTITLRGYFEDIKKSGDFGLILTSYLAISAITTIEATFLYAIQILAQVTSVATFVNWPTFVHAYSEECGAQDQAVAYVSTVLFWMIGFCIFHILIKTFSKGLPSSQIDGTSQLCSALSCLGRKKELPRVNSDGHDRKKTLIQSKRVITPRGTPSPRPLATSPRSSVKTSPAPSIKAAPAASLRGSVFEETKEERAEMLPTCTEPDLYPLYGYYSVEDEAVDIGELPAYWAFSAEKLPKALRKAGLHPSYADGYPLLGQCLGGAARNARRALASIFFWLRKPFIFAGKGFRSAFIDPPVKRVRDYFKKRANEKLAEEWNEVKVKIIEKKEWEERPMKFKDFHVATDIDIEDTKRGRGNKIPKEVIRLALKKKAIEEQNKASEEQKKASEGNELEAKKDESEAKSNEEAPNGIKKNFQVLIRQPGVDYLGYAEYNIEQETVDIKEYRDTKEDPQSNENEANSKGKMKFIPKNLRRKRGSSAAASGAPDGAPGTTKPMDRSRTDGEAGPDDKEDAESKNAINELQGHANKADPKDSKQRMKFIPKMRRTSGAPGGEPKTDVKDSNEDLEAGEVLVERENINYVLLVKDRAVDRRDKEERLSNAKKEQKQQQERKPRFLLAEEGTKKDEHTPCSWKDVLRFQDNVEKFQSQKETNMPLYLKVAECNGVQLVYGKAGTFDDEYKAKPYLSFKAGSPDQKGGHYILMTAKNEKQKDTYCIAFVPPTNGGPPQEALFGIKTRDDLIKHSQLQYKDVKLDDLVPEIFDIRDKKAQNVFFQIKNFAEKMTKNLNSSAQEIWAGGYVICYNKWFPETQEAQTFMPYEVAKKYKEQNTVNIMEIWGTNLYIGDNQASEQSGDQTLQADQASELHKNDNWKPLNQSHGGVLSWQPATVMIKLLDLNEADIKPVPDGETKEVAIRHTWKRWLKPREKLLKIKVSATRHKNSKKCLGGMIFLKATRDSQILFEKPLVDLTYAEKDFGFLGSNDLKDLQKDDRLTLSIRPATLQGGKSFALKSLSLTASYFAQGEADPPGEGPAGGRGNNLVRGGSHEARGNLEVTRTFIPPYFRHKLEDHGPAMCVDYCEVCDQCTKAVMEPKKVDPSQCKEVPRLCTGAARCKFCAQKIYPQNSAGRPVAYHKGRGQFFCNQALSADGTAWCGARRLQSEEGWKGLWPWGASRQQPASSAQQPEYEYKQCNDCARFQAEVTKGSANISSDATAKGDSGAPVSKTESAALKATGGMAKVAKIFHKDHHERWKHSKISYNNQNIKRGDRVFFILTEKPLPGVEKKPPGPHQTKRIPENDDKEMAKGAENDGEDEAFGFFGFLGNLIGGKEEKKPEAEASEPVNDTSNAEASEEQLSSTTASEAEDEAQQDMEWLPGTVEEILIREPSATASNADIGAKDDNTYYLISYYRYDKAASPLTEPNRNGDPTTEAPAAMPEPKKRIVHSSLVRVDQGLVVLDPLAPFRCNQIQEQRFEDGKVVKASGKRDSLSVVGRTKLFLLGKRSNLEPLYEMPSFGEILLLLFWCGKNRELGVCTVLGIYISALVKKLWLFVKLTFGIWDHHLVNAVNIERLDYELNCFLQPSEDVIQKFMQYKAEEGKTFSYQTRGAEEDIIKSVGKSHSLLWQFVPALTFIAKFGEASSQAPIHIGYERIRQDFYGWNPSEQKSFYTLLRDFLSWICCSRCFHHKGDIFSLPYDGPVSVGEVSNEYAQLTEPELQKFQLEKSMDIENLHISRDGLEGNGNDERGSFDLIGFWYDDELRVIKKYSSSFPGGSTLKGDSNHDRDANKSQDFTEEKSQDKIIEPLIKSWTLFLSSECTVLKGTWTDMEFTGKKGKIELVLNQTKKSNDNIQVGLPANANRMNMNQNIPAGNGEGNIKVDATASPNRITGGAGKDTFDPAESTYMRPSDLANAVDKGVKERRKSKTQEEKKNTQQTYELKLPPSGAGAADNARVPTAAAAAAAAAAAGGQQRRRSSIATSKRRRSVVNAQNRNSKLQSIKQRKNQAKEKARGQAGQKAEEQAEDASDDKRFRSLKTCFYSCKAFALWVYEVAMENKDYVMNTTRADNEDKVDENELRWEVTPLLGKHFNFNQIKNPHNKNNTGTRIQNEAGKMESGHPWLWARLQSCCCSNTRAYFYYIELKQALWTPDIVTGRLFNWCIAMVQYVLMVLIAFTAIDGIDFSLDSDSTSDSTSTTSDSELTYDEVDLEELIYSYMEKYLEIAVAFAMLNAALSLNEVFPWTERVEETIEKAEEMKEKVLEAVEGAPNTLAEEVFGEETANIGGAAEEAYADAQEKVAELQEELEAKMEEIGIQYPADEDEEEDEEDSDEKTSGSTTNEKKK